MVHTVYQRANCLDGKGGVRVDQEYTYLNGLAELGVGGAHPGGFKLTQDILSAEHIGKKQRCLMRAAAPAILLHTLRSSMGAK